MIALLLAGIVLYIIGSIMDKHERAERDRYWDERRRRR